MAVIVESGGVHDGLLRRASRSLQLRALDTRDRLLGRTDGLVPPRRLDFVGHSDFAATGEEFLGHFVGLGGLTPDMRVLDVGCGIGRMARPLTRFLGSDGSYDGFDVNADGIAWCRQRYARFTNFRFERADLFNTRYHPGGTQEAASFVFPYEGGAFDFVFATSVLTHLVTAEAERYLRETARVLAPGGRSLITFFLIDDDSRAAIARGDAALAFPIGVVSGPMAVVDPDVPEEAVAFDRGWLEQVLAAAGMRCVNTAPGRWRGGQGASYQDLVIIESA